MANSTNKMICAIARYNCIKIEKSMENQLLRKIVADVFDCTSKKDDL